MFTNCDYYTPVQLNLADTTVVTAYDNKLPILFASSTCETVGVASTTSGFTYGEIIISFFNLTYFLMLGFIIFILFLRGVKIKNVL